MIRALLNLVIKVVSEIIGRCYYLYLYICEQHPENKSNLFFLLLIYIIVGLFFLVGGE